MKKIIVMLFTLMLLTLGSGTLFTNVHANEDEEMEIQIQYAIDSVLQNNNIKDLGDLPETEMGKLVDDINAIKANYIDINAEKLASQPHTRGRTNQYIGRLFLTTESYTHGIRHGHAGIGSDETNAVIEANPGQKIKVYKDRVQSYWSKAKNSGVYGVRGASLTKYKNAYKYAKSKIGKSYGFNALDNNTFYCSELVFYAWKGQGYTINNGIPWGTIILPVHMIADSDTYLVRKYK